MSYLTQSKLAGDSTILQRVVACAAMESVPDPQGWVFANAWPLSSQPGWVEAYEAALGGGGGEPGANEDAITDGMILAAVQALAPTTSAPDLAG